MGQVGQELGVRYVLEGSVRKASNKVRSLARSHQTGVARMLTSKALVNVDLDFSFHRTTKGQFQTLSSAEPKNVVETMGYKFRTKFAESGALETNGLGARIRPKLWQAAVRSSAGKARRYWPFSAPAVAGETVRIVGNGGGLETRIQRSPNFA